MTPPRTLILFDVDGTLIDSQAHILKAMEFAFDAQKLPLPCREDILKIVGLSLFEAFGQLCPDADDAERLALVTSYKNSFSRLASDDSTLTTLPGGTEVFGSPSGHWLLCAWDCNGKIPAWIGLCAVKS